MSQNDMSIANANGADFRADVNSALQALASTSIGSSPPATRYQGQLWINSGSAPWILNVYDGSDDIPIGEISPSNNTFQLVGDIADDNGVLLLARQAVASAINYWTMTNAAAGGLVRLEAVGGDADVGMEIAAKGSDRIALETNGAERVRVTGNGAVLVGSTGVINNERLSVADAVLALVAYLNNTSGPIQEWYSNVGGTETVVARCQSTGNFQNVNNSYGAFSDQRIKQDVVDANSQWADIKALRVVNYRLRPQEVGGAPSAEMIGFIADEVEIVSPALVTADGGTLRVEGADVDDVKTVATSVAFLKMFKAFQEAQARIETLEATTATMQAQIAVLQGV